MDFESESVRKWLKGNLDKGRKNYNNELSRARSEFQKKYPFADLDKFEFWVSNNNKGEIDEPTKIVYTSGKETKLYNETGTIRKYGWDIKSRTFKNKYQSQLFWGTADGIFQPTVDFLPFSMGNGQLRFNLQQFPIYVTEDLHFTSNFEALETTWEGKENDITKAKFDYENDPYFASLCAAYVLFVKTGICSKHLETRDDVPHIIASIMRYYVYYHMKRFLTRPRLMTPFLTDVDVGIVQKLIPTKKVWISKSKCTKETISLFYQEKRKEGKEVKDAKYYGGGVDGVLGTNYKEVTKVTNQSDDDWKKFLQRDTKDITQRGQLLLQKAIESYVYSILGAQVKTRWVIVGVGAKSYQTQVIFHQIAKETVVSSNGSTLISSMRSAIKGSNVALNMAILPGVILIPSNMLILDSPIEGYNNVITIAKKGMQFGKNVQVNFSPTKIAPLPITQTTPLPVTQTEDKVTPKKEGQLTIPTLPKSNSEVVLVLGSSVALGLLIIYLLL